MQFARASAIVVGLLVGRLIPVATAGAQTQPQQTPAQRYAETVVVTATAEPVALDALSRDVSLLTADDIARLPVTSLADLLRYATGIDVRSRGPFGAQADFSVRGAGFGQVVVLVDGVRINDAQTGHHNGDIPVPLAAIDRIEIVRGPGSSLHGADALGGAINIITRRRASGAQARVAAGGFGLLDGDFSLAGSHDALHESLAVAALRSSGFTFDREVASLTASSDTSIGERTDLRVAYQRKAFGANGFYGPAPSKEWTDQTLVSLDRAIASGPRWAASAVWSYRTHGDRFLWDVREPAGFESRHRTHAANGVLKVRRTISATSIVTLGAEAGADWIRSNTLGNDSLAHAGVFGELQKTTGRLSLYASVRYDSYSTFGSTANPSLGAAIALAAGVKLRASAGRAFRVPTFTERYYRDPIHEANPALRPESAWSADAGLDWVAGSAWLVNATVFRRRERDVIDWVRATPQELWRTANIRSVATNGAEFSAKRPAGSAATVGFEYAYLDVNAGRLSLLSLYVLDYARHLGSASAAVRLPAGFSLSQRLGIGRRSDARQHWIWDARIARRCGRLDLSIEGSNLFNAGYQEVRGVQMPGRWLRASIRVLEF